MAATGMQKVDLVIAGVGVLAVLATTLGVVFYDEAVGEETVSFVEVTDEGAFSESPTMASGQQEFTFALPDNATGATFTVDVDWTGQAVNPTSSGSVEVVLIGPDGNQSAPQSAAITATRGAASGGIASPVEVTLRWADVPEERQATDGVDETLTWDQPVTVRITITDPTDTSVAGQGASYSYQVEITGDVFRFQQAAPEIPDPTGAQ